MTTKYTPAPWQAYNAIGGRILNRWHIKGSNHKSLASVHAQDSSEEEAANALLIAAAPSLANMLERVLSEICMTEEGMRHLAPLTLEQARQALQSAGLVS